MKTTKKKLILIKNSENLLDSTTVTGLILAGGRARRMGGIDKGLVELNGKNLVEHCIDAFSPQVDTLLISANRNIEKYTQLGFQVLKDKSDNFDGPLAGLLRALEMAKDNPVLVIPCDAPLLPSNLGRRLLDIYLENETHVVIPHDGDRLQTLFGLFPHSVISSLTEYLSSGQNKVETWVTSLPHTIVDFSNEKEKFMNINTEEDLRQVESLLNNSHLNTSKNTQ